MAPASYNAQLFSHWSSRNNEPDLQLLQPIAETSQLFSDNAKFGTETDQPALANPSTLRRN
jgi:hypothetical protein